MIWIAFFLLWLGGVADYFVQANMHGWSTWGIPAHSTAQKWIWWLDWFPHDWWHWWQLVRNAAWLAGATIIGCTYAHLPWWQIAGILAGVYTVSRGVSSSILMKFR